MVLFIRKLAKLIINLLIKMKLDRKVDGVIRGKSFLYKWRSCGIHLFRVSVYLFWLAPSTYG